jgi:decaprenylphospho-beta-D-erythro-pentofuranosid-2-ulose 2-reductase
MRDGLGGISTVALIGGTSDIGLAIAHALTSLGASRVVLAGRNVDAMRTASEGLPVDDMVALDLTSGDHSGAVQSIFAGGDVDVVVLAAGVLHNDPDPDQIAEMTVVNGSGSVAVLAQVARAFEAQGHGHLIVLSSIAAVRPRPSNYWYGASKATLDFAARGLSDQLLGSGIRVTVVRPGFVRSKMTDGMDSAPFSVDPEEVGRAVMAAVRDGVEGVLWVPGVLRWVSLVLQWLPLPLLKRVDR